ncbi:FAD-binding oxidoreductase [Phanerochaete sordida]|uniref:FAD-binding oxidoreductase n=1 Tax=Phanerochaete sordida TaxID=48140 RepID=A0A9P3LEW4_9APHY|nr:FAD-binding oxidoreductase [Phanerochaete sordida]
MLVKNPAQAQEEDNARKVVIVGAGVFGLSTAWYLLQRGYSVTVLERASVVPARDSAGYDLNKVVRSSYADSFYTTFAREAIDMWKKEEWDGCYHECGVFLPVTTGNPYTSAAYDNDVASGANVTAVRSAEDIKKFFPDDVPTGFAAPSGDVLSGYINHDGGWAESGRALELLLERVRAAGAEVLAGKEVAGLMRKGAANGTQTSPRVAGVRCTDGSGYRAETVIIAAGAWTPRLTQRLGIEFTMGVWAQKPENEATRVQQVQELQQEAMGQHVGVGVATGQVVATIQLTEEDADRYRATPVVLDFGSGFYMFPPTKDNIVKMGINNYGYLHQPSSAVPSTPRTALTDGEDGLRIPKEMVEYFRNNLKKIYPELGKKPFSGTRLCWYNDSPDEDWVIGYHPAAQGLLFATTGSGHAFKFLPNIGRLVADAMEGKLPPALASRFSPHRKAQVNPTSRVGPLPRPLKLDELCVEADLSADID